MGATLRTNSNSAVVPATWDADATPMHNDFCCQLSSDEPIAVDLQVTVNNPATPAFLFPSPSPYRLPAGCIAAGAGTQTHSIPCGFLKIELGGGSDARVLFCDLVSGRFALGAQRYVNVSAWGWSGSSLRTEDLIVQTSLVPADGTGDYLEVTYPITVVAGGGVANLIAPPGARFVDAGVKSALIGIAGSALIRCTFGMPMIRDYSTPLFVPGLGSPSPIYAAGGGYTGFTFLNNGAADLTTANPGWVKFWCA